MRMKKARPSMNIEDVRNPDKGDFGVGSPKGDFGEMPMMKKEPRLLDLPKIKKRKRTLADG